jgi:hypothetical protein
MDYSNPLSKSQNNYSYLAAPPLLHKKLCKIIKGTLS